MYFDFRTSSNLFKASIALDHLLIWLSLVGAWYLTTTPTLSSFVPLFSIVVALPHELPL